MTDDDRDATLDRQARAAYSAYGAEVGWKNFQGSPMPQWQDLGGTIQAAWRAAAKINFAAGYRLGYADSPDHDPRY